MSATDFACDTKNSGYKQLLQFLCSYNLCHCDDVVSSSNKKIYVNEALGKTSCSDHVFASSNLKAVISDICIVDSDINCSDHRPLYCTINCLSNLHNVSPSAKVKAKQSYSIRWDKVNLTDYYNVIRTQLDSFKFDYNLTRCYQGCQYSVHKQLINTNYHNIVNALSAAERITVPLIPHRALRPFWNEEFDDLKQKLCFGISYGKIIVPRSMVISMTLNVARN